MYNASDILRKAKNFYIYKNNHKRKRLGIVKKHSFYLTDKKYYWDIYLKSDHWKQLRKKKLEADSKCEYCQSLKNLDVHHIRYKQLYDVELEDLKTLCRKCHKLEHKSLKDKKLDKIETKLNESYVDKIRKRRKKFTKNSYPEKSKWYEQEQQYLEQCRLERFKIQKDMRDYNKSNDFHCQ